MELSRRSFLATGALIASPADAAVQVSGTPRAVVFPRPTLPVLRSVDIVVAGGSFGGVSAALELAGAGRKVLLIEQRTYLGREVSATIRPWYDATAQKPQWFKRLGNSPFHMDRLKLALEDLLLEAGVDLLYGCHPLALDPAGLIIANKSGRQLLRCNGIVDATPTALVARFAGATFAPPPDAPALFYRTLEFDGVAPLDRDTLDLPADLQVEGNRARVHPGATGGGHYLVECGFRMPVRAFDPLEDVQREIHARKLSIAVVSYLMKNNPAFGKAFLARTSYELHGPAPVLEQPPRIRGVWRLEAAADACAAAMAGANLARRVIPIAGGFDLPEQTGESAESPLELREPDSPCSGRYQETAIRPMRAEIWREVDVLIVGGGSSGATAAAVASREEVRTMVLDLNPGLGGTGTFGSVDSYWFGHHTGFNSRVKARVKEIQDSIGYEPAPGWPPKWSVEAKMHALLLEANAAEIVFPTLVAGAIVEKGNRVCGVLAATPYGPRVILAKAVVDCTGDGDVAVFAGAEATKGSGMDHHMMWYSLSQWSRPGKYAGSFTSSLDMGDVEDYTRCILLGRRRGNNCSDHSIYLATRESRHIAGEVTITMTDIYRQRRWPDVVNIHFSNSDMKGKTTSPWFLAGLIAPQLETEIPYRACLPRGLENILVAGKAFSTTHDALAGIRMQADLENLGGVLALAAAKAVKENRTVRGIDVAELQQRLVREEILPPPYLRRKIRHARTTDAEMRRAIALLLEDKPLTEYQNMKHWEIFRGPIPFVEVCTAGPRIVPMLEAALETAPAGRRIVIAQALAMLGSRSGVPVLVETLAKMLGGQDLPLLDHKIQYSHFAPDHGSMPMACHYLYSLGMARDARVIPIWDRVAELLRPSAEDYGKVAENPYHYVDAVCFGAERLGDPHCLAALQRIYSQPTLRDLVWRSGFDTDLTLERRATLELALGKAMARCASADGFRILTRYLYDSRALLAEQAYSNLVRISGRDEGRNPAPWIRWLDGARIEAKPLAFAEDLDAWFEQDVLISA